MLLLWPKKAPQNLLMPEYQRQNFSEACALLLSGRCQGSGRSVGRRRSHFLALAYVLTQPGRLRPAATLLLMRTSYARLLGLVLLWLLTMVVGCGRDTEQISTASPTTRNTTATHPDTSGLTTPDTAAVAQ